MNHQLRCNFFANPKFSSVAPNKFNKGSAAKTVTIVKSKLTTKVKTIEFPNALAVF